MMYFVSATPNSNQVIILANDADVQDGFEVVGNFTVEPGEPLSINGEHIFIVKAREVLTDEEIPHDKNTTFIDKASNSPDMVNTKHEDDVDAKALSTNTLESTQSGDPRGTTLESEPTAENMTVIPPATEPEEEPTEPEHVEEEAPVPTTIPATNLTGENAPSLAQPGAELPASDTPAEEPEVPSAEEPDGPIAEHLTEEEPDTAAVNQKTAS